MAPSDDSAGYEVIRVVEDYPHADFSLDNTEIDYADDYPVKVDFSFDGDGTIDEALLVESHRAGVDSFNTDYTIVAEGSTAHDDNIGGDDDDTDLTFVPFVDVDDDLTLTTLTGPSSLPYQDSLKLTQHLLTLGRHQ